MQKKTNKGAYLRQKCSNHENPTVNDRTLDCDTFVKTWLKSFEKFKSCAQIITYAKNTGPLLP